MEDRHYSAGRGLHQWLPDRQGVGRPPVFRHRVLLLQGGQMQRPDTGYQVVEVVVEVVEEVVSGHRVLLLQGGQVQRPDTG